MKKFFAVVLAFILVASSIMIGFATEYPVSSVLSYSDIFPQFDIGNNNFYLPFDFSSLPSYDLYKEKLQDRENYDIAIEFDSSRLYMCLFIYPKGSLYFRLGSYTHRYDSGKDHRTYNCSTHAYLGTSSSEKILSLSCYGFDTTRNVFVPSNLSVVSGDLSAFCSWATWASAGVFRDTSWLNYFWYIPNYNEVPSRTSSEFLVDNCQVISDANFIVYDVNLPPPIPSTHALTVNYQYTNGTPAADPVTQSLAPGTEYSIPSPEVAGYTPDVPLVTGTMPEEDLTVTVTYTKAFYPLTVQYQYTDGSQAAESISFQYPLGFAYDIPSPEIAGYQPDKPTVAGEMPGEALEEVVTYSAIPYTLTVRYRFPDGSQAAPDHQEQLTIGSGYSVPSPVIEGYHPSQTAITGVMPASDVVSTVTYREDSGGSSGSGSSGPGGGGDSGGGSSGGGGSGDDPFIPALPPFSDYDPFLIPGVPSFSGYNPFIVPSLPPFSGYDPFMIPKQGGT